jgi:hypothetical protein
MKSPASVDLVVGYRVPTGWHSPDPRSRSALGKLRNGREYSGVLDMTGKHDPGDTLDIQASSSGAQQLDNRGEAHREWT